MSDDEAYQTPAVPIGCDGLARRLVMARFAYHKQIEWKYRYKMQLFQIGEEEAREEYRKSMANYDEILGLAEAEPERIKACLDAMAGGFQIKDAGAQ